MPVVKRRRLLQFLFVIGLLFGLTAATLWVRGVCARDTIRVRYSWIAQGRFMEHDLFFITGVHQWNLTWRKVDDSLAIWRETGGRPVGFHVSHESGPAYRFGALPSESGRFWTRLGFMHRTEADYRGAGLVQQEFVLPAWFIMLVGAALMIAPGRRLWSERRSRLRAARGLCPACAYDLRGAAHERCPECGAVVTLQSAPA